MIPAHLPTMIAAEIRAIFGRASGMAVLAVSLVVGVVASGSLLYLQSRTGSPDAVAQFNGVPITSMMDFSAQSAAAWGLKARNFFVLPVLLLLAAASTLAGELGDRTLREVLVRPVPRWSVLAAKLAALVLLSLASHLLTFALAFGGGLLLGTESPTPLSAVGLGYLASWGSDLGVLLIGFAASVFVQSVGGVVVGVLLFLMADTFVRMALWGLDKLGIAWAATAGQFMPGNALACWEGFQEGWLLAQFAGLAVLVVVAGFVAVARFQRMDVP